MNQKKVLGVIGLGHVGAHVDYSLAVQGIADELVLVDGNAQKLASEVQDLRDAAADLPHRVTVRAGEFSDLGACLLSWHIKKVPSTAQIDRLCDFLISLEEPYGVRVPVILRPCSDGLNAGFWQTLRERFEDKKVVNTLLAYTVPKLSARSDASGDKSANLKDMMENIDILGIELFDLSKSADKDTMGVYSKQLDESLSSLEKMGKDYSKPVAIFATGAESVPYESWFTEILLPVLDKHSFSFILFGRNDNHHPGHFFVPFPGHPAVSDFTKFANSPRTLFLRETNGLYILRGDDVK